MGLFRLEIITPERVFFSAPVEACTVEGEGGQLTILSNHTSMVAVVKTGRISIRDESGERYAFTADGFMEVRPDETLIFAQKCEWPEEIDENRALADEEEALARLQRKQSIVEYKESRIMLIRALTRLRVKGNPRKG